ncbi:hypothetical protein ALC56_00080, partial [Trachymyrmex septentrionalis]
HIEPRQFLEDAREIVLKCVQIVTQRHDNIKLNTVFNGEFVSGDKRANKSVSIKNYKHFTALHPVQSYTNEELSYSYYTTVLNFKDIQFLNRNKRFENLNDISINVYDIEKQKEMTIFSCLHYFSSSAKLKIHAVDCEKLNNCAIRLPSEDDKWLSFSNYIHQEETYSVHSLR